MKTFLKITKNIVGVCLVLLLTATSVYIYKNFEMKWYFLLLFAIIAVAINSFIGSWFIDFNGKMQDGMLIALIVMALTSFLIPPISHRIIFLFVLIGASGAFPALENHSKKEINQVYATALLTAFFVFSFIYFAVKTSGLTRFWNIVAAILFCLMAAHFYEEHEGVKEYDKEEDKFNNSRFGRASNHSFEEIRNNKGLAAEYVTSTWLSDIKSYHKILFNVFTPAYENRFVSEIDAIVISKSGIDVLEVKNQRKEWLIIGEGKDDAKAYNQYGKLIKESQKNPFHQNRIHKENLVHLLRSNNDQRIRSLAKYVGGYVVFGSDTIGWDITNVKQGYCKYTSIGKLINKGCNNHSYLTEEEINLIYKFLYKYQNNHDLKVQHRWQVKY